MSPPPKILSGEVRLIKHSKIATALMIKFKYVRVKVCTWWR